MENDHTSIELLKHALSDTDIHTGAPEYAVGRLMGKYGGVGSWSMELATRKFQLSTMAREISGFSSDDKSISLEDVLSRFHEDDRKKAGQVFIDALHHKCAFSYNLRIYNARNELRDVECFGDVLLDADKKVLSLVGTLRDVSALTELESLAASRILMIRALLRHMPMAVAILNHKMIYLSASQYWVSGHGFRKSAEMVGKSHYELFDSITDDMKADHRKVLAGETLHKDRAHLTDKNGRPIKQKCVFTPWYHRDGEVGGMIMMLKDVDTDYTLDPHAMGNATPQEGEFERILAEMRL